MRRREFMAGLGGTAAAWPLAALAQQPAGKVYRVGVIAAGAPVAGMAGPDPVDLNFRAFLHTLRDLGYVEGKNLVLERRSAEGRLERSGDIVAELIQRKVDVIVVSTNTMAAAAKRVTQTVPIVMATSGSPVEAKLVASLARPGGNVTGFTLDAGPEIYAKRLQLLKEAVPEATRVAFLGTMSYWKGVEGELLRAAARTLGLALVHAEHGPSEYGDAFAMIVRDRPQALYVSNHPTNFANRQLIADFALLQRLPGMFPFRENVEAGGLMSYGTSLRDQYRRVAGYVDRILKGAKPADLAVQQPVKFEMVLNMKAARAMGLTIAPLLLAQADEVIE